MPSSRSMLVVSTYALGNRAASYRDGGEGEKPLTAVHGQKLAQRDRLCILLILMMRIINLIE
ncbi:hypothetical protein REMIM1_PC00039 (plasmid) [Rhizobium etli bv. mimosae str. Mim1]|nr:hypothetical protein REMIM1_PC00039 [Rhizobium etli bv. mimosae str. Mim1]